MSRLLLICEYPSLLGGEQSMLSTLPMVREVGFKVIAVVPPRGPLQEHLIRLGVQIVPFQMADVAGRRLPLALLRHHLMKIIDACRPDLLDANSLSVGRLVGPLVSALKLPSVTHIRDIVKISRTAMNDLNQHARLLPVSVATRRYHVEAGMAAKKSVVLYNGVDLQRFRPACPSGFLHRELGLPRDSRLVATVGQISLRKGMDIFLRSARQVARRFVDLHFLVVGRRTSTKPESYALEVELRRLAHTSELIGRVHFLGFRNDMPHLLPELTLLVHAARQEPLGRVLLEAAASGVAVAATDVGGTREIFSPAEELASLVPPGDASALAHAMERLVSQPGQRAAMAAKARSRMATTFDVEQAAQALVGHYHEVLR